MCVTFIIKGRKRRKKGNSQFAILATKRLKLLKPARKSIFPRNTRENEEIFASSKVDQRKKREEGGRLWNLVNSLISRQGEKKTT